MHGLKTLMLLSFVLPVHFIVKKGRNKISRGKKPSTFFLWLKQPKVFLYYNRL